MAKRRKPHRAVTIMRLKDKAHKLLQREGLLEEKIDASQEKLSKLRERRKKIQERFRRLEEV